MDFGLKKILVFFLFLILSICDNLLIPAYGQSLQITAVNLKCSGQTRCATYNDHFRELIGEYTSIQHFTTSFLLFSDEEDFAKLGYEVIESKDGNHVLQIYLDLNPLISKLDIYVHGDDSWLIENNLPLQEGDIFEVDQLSKMRKELSRQLKDGSYFNFDIDINRKSTDLKQAYVTANIVPGKKTMVRNISIKSENSEIRKLIYRQLISYMHAPFNIVEFKQRLEDLETFLFNQGYYFTELAYDGFERIDQYNVNLKINVLGEEQYFFYFHGNETFDRSSLLTYMKQQLQKYNKDIATSAMAEILEEFYSTHAFHQAKIEVKERYRDQIYPGKRYYITIEENKRSTIQKIEFLGNVAFSDSHLKDVYDDNASSLANSGYFDQEYVELFSEQLQKFYIENGFLFAKISEPNIKKNDSNILIQYSIVEGSKTYVGNINLEGIPKEALDAVREVLDFKSEQIFNPYLIDENIAKVNKLLKSRGYYFAEPRELKADQIVKYSQDYSQANLHFSFNSGPQIYFRKMLILGNEQTKDIVIRREIHFQKGDLITPRDISLINERLRSLAIFSQVDVKPLRNTITEDNFLDVLIEVQEANFQTVEVAPGFRTDIGFKVSGSYNHYNLMDMNRGFTLEAEINRRTNFDGIASGRPKSDTHFLEYEADATYHEPYLFGRDLGYNASLSQSRKRFYSFDADISRLSNTLAKVFSNRLTATLRYQFENITQFNAVDNDDEGTFQIGSLTPAMAIDFRDKEINPNKGAYFDWSWEYSHPYLGSQDEEERRIEYYRLIARNYFYVPFPGGVWAFYGAGGMEENLAEGSFQGDSYSIPRIKIFRLSGIDNVRGFDDEEINRLPDGTDIKDIDVTDKAYFTNFKVEPRFFLSDNVMIAPFWDMGRVFVNSVDFSKLRHSVGLSFRYITPVGAVRLDYGHKLHRRKLPGGGLEDPGRLHVAIGNF